MYVCMSVCMYVCMYVCMHIPSTSIHTHIARCIDTSFCTTCIPVWKFHGLHKYVICYTSIKRCMHQCTFGVSLYVYVDF